jgi:hypothetical protein
MRGRGAAREHGRDGRADESRAAAEQRANAESAALQALRREVELDSFQLEALRARLNEAGQVALFASYRTLEAQCARAHAIRTRLRQLSEKYASAAAAPAGSGAQPQNNVTWLSATTRH